MPIFFDYKCYSCGGLGDFVRSALCFYSWCGLKNIDFILSITRHPISEYFLHNSPITQQEEIVIDHVDQPRTKTEELLKDILLNAKKPYRLFSNVAFFLEYGELKPFTKDFLQLIKPNEKVEKRIEELLTGIQSNNYRSIHIRFGDQTMKEIVCPKDRRIDSSIAKQLLDDLYSKYRYDQTLTILHTDSDALKEKLKRRYPKFHFLTNSPKHISLTTDDCLDDLAEFHIIGRSSHTVMVTLSGFPLWSYFIYNNKVLEPVYKRLTQIAIIKE